MSRKKTESEILAECEAADRERAEAYRAQRDCLHPNAEATRFHWSTGRVAQLRCPDCGAVKYMHEEDAYL